MHGPIERLVATCGLPGFAYRSWTTPELPGPSEAPAAKPGTSALEAQARIPAPEPRVLPTEATVAPATPPEAAPVLPAPALTSAARPPLHLPAPEPISVLAGPPSRHGFARPAVVLPPPEGAERMVPRLGFRIPADRRHQRRPPVHVPVAPPPRPAAASPPRRFALLEEIAQPGRREAARRHSDSP